MTRSRTRHVPCTGMVMLLTVLFVVTGVVGAVVLVVEIGSALRRRRIEREWRKGRAENGR